MNLKFEVVHCSKRTYRVDEDILIHYHRDAHLYLVLKGNPVFYIEDREYSLKKGDVLFIPPKFGHRMPSNGHECVLLSIRILILDEFFKKYLQKVYGPIQSDEITQNVFSYVHKNSRFREPQNIENINCILSAILLSFFHNEVTYQNRDSHITKMGKYSELTKKSILYIDSNFLRNFNLSEMGNHLNYNYSYLCRVFKKETKLTISQYVIFQRLRHANDLIIYNNYDLSTASICAGFNELSYFSKIYKRTFGFPAVYLKKLLQIISEEDRKGFFLNLELLNFRQTTLGETFQQFEDFKKTVIDLLKKYNLK